MKEANETDYWIDLLHESELIESAHYTAIHPDMESLMPTWRGHRAELNRAPLAHEEWTY